MNGLIYQNRPLLKISFFQQLLKQLPEENALIEVNNLLASRPVMKISADEIEAIERHYNISLKKEFALNLEEFYAVYLNYCLQDKVLNEQELKELSHLRSILNLEHRTVEKLHVKLGEVIYKKSFEEAVADGRLTAEENDFLHKLKSTLHLPDDLANKISGEVRSAFIQNYITKVIAHQSLSPSEEQEIKAVAASLNVNIQAGGETKAKLEKLKLYWAIENLDLPAVNVSGTALQKSEVCYFTIENAKWYELRKSSPHFSNNGAANSFNAIKAYYLRSGAKGAGYSMDVMKLADQGTLYITNKRILLTGARNHTVRTDKIAAFTPLDKGMEVRKDGGRNIAVQIGDHADVLCMVLEKVLAGVS